MVGRGGARPARGAPVVVQTRHCIQGGSLRSPEALETQTIDGKCWARCLRYEGWVCKAVAGENHSKSPLTKVTFLDDVLHRAEVEAAAPRGVEDDPMMDLLDEAVPAVAGRPKLREARDRAVSIVMPEAFGAKRQRRLPVLLTQPSRSRKAQTWLLLEDLPWAVAYMQAEVQCHGVPKSAEAEPAMGLEWEPARSLFVFRRRDASGRLVTMQRVVPRFRRHNHVALGEAEYAKRKLESCRSLMDEVAKAGWPTEDFLPWLGCEGK